MCIYVTSSRGTGEKDYEERLRDTEIDTQTETDIQDTYASSLEDNKERLSIEKHTLS